MLKKSLLALACAFSTTVVLSSTVVAEGWGHVSGQLVLDGEVPEVDPLVAKGDPNAKDAAACAANAVPNDAMQFDKESKGIANIAVYMRKASKVHPDLKESEEKSVVFDQQGCNFLPHMMVVRTDQTIVCKSSDTVSHNVHTYPFSNTPENFIVQPNDSKGVEVKMPLAELLVPYVEVKCDIHPWMHAWWLVVDHPYATITGADGTFKIENLPEGDNEFYVWHEKIGFIGQSGKPVSKKEAKWTVTVKDGEMTDLEKIAVPVDAFTAE